MANELPERPYPATWLDVTPEETSMGVKTAQYGLGPDGNVGGLTGQLIVLLQSNLLCRERQLAGIEILLTKEREAREAAERSKNGAYAERDRLVAALSMFFPASLERHPDSDATWENDWRWIVYMDTPAGQLSWHIHDSELPWFDHLPRLQGRAWDGHTTEQKYDRLPSACSMQIEFLS